MGRVSIRRDAGPLAARLEPFDAGNVKGTRPTLGEGWMPRDEALMLRHLRDGIDYMVWSYATPVAVHHRTLGWLVTRARHSQTTTRQLTWITPHLTGWRFIPEPNEEIA